MSKPKKPTTIDEILETHIEHEPRICVYIPGDAFVESENGYRVSFVKEGVSGHFPSGVWPYDPRKPKPWFWGPTYEDAQAAAKGHNEQMGLSPDDVTLIVASSIGAQRKGDDRV